MEENGKEKRGWGHPRDNQIEASCWSFVDEKESVPELKFLGLRLRRAGEKMVRRERQLSISRGDTIPDDKILHRKFSFRCGLIKALSLVTERKTDTQLYLDGYDNVRISADSVAIRFAENTNEKIARPDSSLLEKTPVAIVNFEGNGERYGTLYQHRVTSVVLWFKDREQFEQHVVAVIVPTQREAEKLIQRTVVRDSGSSLLPFAVGLGLGIALD